MANDYTYRADHVGSLLPPPALIEARARHARGEIGADGLQEAENAAVKEQLRRMEEGQRILIEQLNSLRARLDRSARIDASAGQPIAAPGTADASVATTDAASTGARDASTASNCGSVRRSQ